MQIKAKKQKKERIHSTVIFYFVLFLFCASDAFSLESMKKDDLKKASGQAGVSIGISDLVIVHSADSIKFLESTKPDAGYIALENISGINIFETGDKDVDGDGYMGHLSIDVGHKINSETTTADDIVMTKISCPDWDQMINMKIGKINWCGKNIGSAEIVNFSLPIWEAYIGAFNGNGIDFELGFRTRIEEIMFTYGQAGEKLSIKGLAAAGSFTGDPQDPSSWVPSGTFRIGDAMNDTPNPASTDIGLRDDSDGTTTRYTPVIKMSTSASGSVRADNISFGNANFGAMAIDGIKVHKMTIELPGRGLGTGK